jgi:isopenicillin N synthase-like dioxygenase
MKNAKSFLGYSRLSAEITAGEIDHREQIDLSTEHEVPSPSDPLYYNLLAPNQWPSPEVAPGFRETFTDYMSRMYGYLPFQSLGPWCCSWAHGTTCKDLPY